MLKRSKVPQVLSAIRYLESTQEISSEESEQLVCGIQKFLKTKDDEPFLYQLNMLGKVANVGEIMNVLN